MDTIGNMLSTIKNALAVRKKTVVVPASIFKKNILDILKVHNYIEDYKTNTKDKKTSFTIKLKYNNDEPAISYIKRISKPGLRVYVKNDHIPRILGGLGIVIVSTPKGVFDGRIAKSKKLGGELICEIY